MAGQNERRLREDLAPNLIEVFSEHNAQPGAQESIEAEAALIDAVQARASDIHLDPQEDGYSVRLRIDGTLVDVAWLTTDSGLKLVNQFRALAYLDPVNIFRPKGGRFSYLLDEAELDVRVTEAPCIAGEKLAIRILNPEQLAQGISELGFYQQDLSHLENWLDTIGGMLLIAGPTGSGKTTTLYALLHHLKMSSRHVLTLEEPVEYEIPGINQMPVNADRGLDYQTGAQAMLRLDPDYLVIGELIEKHSAQAAVNAAAGGRASMATVHSRDAVDTLAVLRNFGLDDFEIAANLELVVAQRLVRRLCRHCRFQQEPSELERRWLASLELPEPEQVWGASGCPACDHLGFHGRIGIFEIWRPSDEDYARILNHGDSHQVRKQLAERGHKFMLDDGLDKASEGIISLAELRRLGAVGATRAKVSQSLISG